MMVSMSARLVRLSMHLAVTLALTLIVAAGVNAHHSIQSEYDVSKIVTLTGQVTHVDWAFPHVTVGLHVGSGANAETDWELETLNPQGLQRAGVDASSLKAGDAIRTTVYLARDESHRAVTQTVTLASGRMVTLQVGAGALPATTPAH
jgi:hypothetical protein